MNYGNRKPPKLSELLEIMIKKFGNINKKGKWVGIKIKDDEEQENDDEINELDN
jgi:hypothetical protein